MVINMQATFIRRHLWKIATTFILTVLMSNVMAAENSRPRDYWKPPTENQRKDIAYIVRTLSETPYTKIMFYQSSLREAGNRVENVHPLNFLGVIFTDENLKAGVRNIRTKEWFWKQFIGGTKRSLAEEAGRDNLTDQQLNDFAKRVGVDPQLLYKPVHQKQWDEFVEVLIQKVPRSGGHNRYDI